MAERTKNFGRRWLESAITEVSITEFLGGDGRSRLSLRCQSQYVRARLTRKGTAIGLRLEYAKAINIILIIVAFFCLCLS